VICTGNPRVIFTIPGPVPVNNPYPLNGYRYSHGLIKLDPRVHLYPYPWRVTRGYPINWRILSYFNLNVYTKNENTEGTGGYLSSHSPLHPIVMLMLTCPSLCSSPLQWWRQEVGVSGLGARAQNQADRRNPSRWGSVMGAPLRTPIGSDGGRW
jgi:hypothetical protein